MNLTVGSSIIELSIHACIFVLKALDREGPGDKVWPKFMSKLLPKTAIFQKISLFTCRLA